MHAEREYGPHNPYLTYRLFDVEHPVAPQGFGTARYDLVIAANVLHATRDIRRTLRNAKALLRPNGLLLLNELSTKSLFTHLTFGLLEGWWRYEDVPLRLPGCPALALPAGAGPWKRRGSGRSGSPPSRPTTWGSRSSSPKATASSARRRAPVRAVHEPSRWTPSPPTSGSGWGKPGIPSGPPSSLRKRADNFRSTPPSPRPGPKRRRPSRSGPRRLRGRATAYVRALVGETLKIPAAEIDPAAPLEAYGIDSILVVRLANRFREVFDNITSTLFFEYQTVDALVSHLLETRQEALIALVGGDKPLPPRGDWNEGSRGAGGRLGCALSRASPYGGPTAVFCPKIRRASAVRRCRGTVFRR